MRSLLALVPAGIANFGLPFGCAYSVPVLGVQHRDD
jgi:hypothetical protein